jgi:hypothetical protein
MQIAANISKSHAARVARGCGIASICLAIALTVDHFAIAQADIAASAQAPDAKAAATKTQPLDSVIAVVNNQVILASDLELEMRIFRLIPIGDRDDAMPAKALERLTTRALIEQQILLEDPNGLEVAPKEVEDSLAELRQSLPDCKHRDCISNAGWAAYLATLDLTPERVTDYWSRRMAVLRFIELRFRSGIRITPEEIQAYYRDTLIPKYAKPQDAPPLEKVSPRIQEVLLQQRVNALLNDWLKSLQDQGQVEILDPALKAASKAEETAPGSSNGATQPSQSGSDSSGPGEGGRP